MRSFFVGVMFVAAACVVGGTAAQGKPKKPPADTAECQDDTDCVLVTDGCCGCNEGGKQRVVPKKARENYEKKRQAICKKTMCPQLMSEDKTCEARAVCKNKVCALSQ
jgi:hypothetical protein